MRFTIAFRAFFAAMFSGDKANRLKDALQGDAPAGLPAPSKETEQPKKPQQPKPPVRSEALTLLAALQREARFIDIVKEPLGDYSDAQVGAAARDVLRDCGQVLDRFFAIAPLVDEADGTELTTDEPFAPARWKITGNVSGEPPFTGALAHHGWEAKQCELPAWSGDKSTANIIAPVELELS